ncbi:RNA polymerase II [Perkinsus chesapeaki]|uniref:RNA polymerase II n=1 Tax=Perkinsus chesapeaki TaxID=330153 RepID=A0A7J6MYC2_PERCH|nr:RNA polymerase II [Perkinsus chesapeaki]
MASSMTANSQQDYKVWASLLGGSCGSATAKTVTAPLSRLTILYQVSSMGATKTVHSHDSIYKTMKNILEKEGLSSMWRGNLVSVIHKFPCGAINYYVYEKAKLLMHPLWSSPTDPGISCRFIAGFMGGCAANVVTYPLDLVRTRLATNDTVRNWGIVPTLREISRTEGLSSLFKGLGVTIWCQGLNIAINFAIYETLQVRAIEMEKWIFRQVLGIQSFNASDKQRGTWVSSLLCGAMAGTTASTIIFPLDLIRRRQQMCVGMAAPSFIAVAKEIIAKESIRGLYRGLVPELIKVIPAVGINFYVYELVRQEILGVRISPRQNILPPLPSKEGATKRKAGMGVMDNLDGNEQSSPKRQAIGGKSPDALEQQKGDCPHDLVWQGMCANCCAIVDQVNEGGPNGGQSSASPWTDTPLSMGDDYEDEEDDDNEDDGSEQLDSDDERRLAMQKGGYYATEFLSADEGIRVSAALAASLESSTIRTLASSRRLVAVLDIDHTILHVTNKRIDLLFPDVTCYNLAPNKETGRLDENKVYQFFIGNRGSRTGTCCYLKLRPGFYTFLEDILPLYELYLYTHGTREYAVRLLKALDPTCRYFGSPPRLIARPTQSALTCKMLSKIFPSNHRLAVIVDDRDDVWEPKDNEHSLIKVTPYVFFPDSERLRVSLEGQLNAIIAAGSGKRAMAPLAEYHHPADTSSSSAPTPPEEGAPPRDLRWLEMADSDKQLHYVTGMLRNIHARTYAAAQLATSVGDDLDPDKLDVRPIIPAIREQTLEGLRVGHSGLVPSNYWDSEQHPVIRLLNRLGATIISDITHPAAGSSGGPPIDVLVASNMETRKAQQAMAMGVPVVHVWYLLHALATWQRPKFGPFKLSVVESTPMRVHWQAPQLYARDPHESDGESSPRHKHHVGSINSTGGGTEVDSSSEEGFVGGLTVDEDDLLAALEGGDSNDDEEEEEEQAA